MIDIDFSHNGGVVTFDDFPIEEERSLENYIDDLKEDMFQVEFPKGYVLDIGWRPSFEIKGKFYVVLIKDFNWSEPIYSATAKSVIELKGKINKALGIL
ncbi:hypothetical protein AAFN90_10085 [Erwiniaceae bacterium CAU 1747]